MPSLMVYVLPKQEFLQGRTDTHDIAERYVCNEWVIELRACIGIQAVAVVQRSMRQLDPAEVMADLGFGEVYLVASFSVSMSGIPLHQPS